MSMKKPCNEKSTLNKVALNSFEDQLFRTEVCWPPYHYLIAVYLLWPWIFNEVLFAQVGESERSNMSLSGPNNKPFSGIFKHYTFSFSKGMELIIFRCNMHKNWHIHMIINIFEIKKVYIMYIKAESSHGRNYLFILLTCRHEIIIKCSQDEGFSSPETAHINISLISRNIVMWHFLLLTGIKSHLRSNIGSTPDLFLLVREISKNRLCYIFITGKCRLLSCDNALIYDVITF